jgi:hypothetical protein
MNTPRTDELSGYWKQSETDASGAAFELARTLERENAVLRELLREKVFFADRDSYRREGYTLDTYQGRSYLDINYRNMPLHKTADDAINAAIEQRLKEVSK